MGEIFTKPDVHSLQKSMKELFDNNIFTDIKLNVGGTIFSVHKCVLYCNSPMLKNMLTSETADKYKEEIELKELDVDNFRLVLHYMYTEKIKITRQNVVGILTICDYLEMQDLRQFCLSILEKILDSKNAIEIRNKGNYEKCLMVKQQNRVNNLCIIKQCPKNTVLNEGYDYSSACAYG